MKKIQKIMAAGMVALFILIAGCGSKTQLTPARKIEGRWKTSSHVMFYIKTDFCTDNLSLVANQDRMVTMDIKETGDYTVDITLTYAGSNFTVVNSACDSSTGYTPDVSPMYLHGDIASTQLTVMNSESKVLGIFTFTSDLMQGTWNDQWCMVYCQDVSTTTKGLKLTLQH